MTAARPFRIPAPRRVAAVAVGIALLISALFLLPIEAWIVDLREWAQAHGLLGWLVFALVYAVLTYLLVPGSLLMLAGGLAFGLAGIVPVMIGTALGGAAGYFTGCRLLRARAPGFLASRPRLAAVEDVASREGWRIVLLLRLSGIIPFNLQNCALGAARIRFIPYMIATMIGMAPAVIKYVWIGALGGVASEGAAGAGTWALLAIGVTATFAVALIISLKARAALHAYGVDGVNGEAEADEPESAETATAAP